MQRSTVKLGEVVQSISKTFKFTSAPVVFLNTSDVLNGKVLNHELISPVGLPGQAKKTIQTHDILFSEIRPANRRFAYVDFEANNFVVSTKLMVLRCNERICPKYLYFYLTSNEMLAYLQQQAEGRSGTFPQITFDEIRYLEISLPPLAEQRQIAAILSSLDDKIELNRRMNQTLEQLAQTLFRQWFVAFDFPDATGQPYRSSGGELVESELGEIPRGWRVGSLDTIATYLNGLALQKFPADGPDSLPVIKIREMRQGITDTSDRASRAIGEKYIIQDGDVLFSWSGTLDVILWSGGEGALNQHLFKVSSTNYPKWFYYLWTLYHLEQFKQIAKDKATTMGHIQRRHLTEAKVLIPYMHTLQMMHRIAEPLLSQQLNNMLQSRTLATLRDTLLPQLLSGRLTVRAAAEVVA